MQNTSTTTSTTLKTVSKPGTLINTQQVANLVGRNWQFINRQRHAGKFIDPAAKLKGTGAYLYKLSEVRKWAKQNGHTLAS